MARKPKLYQKLARRRGGVGTYYSLWLAPDHVLQVEANMMTERYQRVRLQDIQGFFVTPSRQAFWVTVISLIVLTGSVGLIVFNDGPAQVGFIALGIPALLMLLYGLFLARNCHFHVLTAVQRANWRNIARRRQAKKLIARLSPLIHEAQRGELAPPAAMASTNGDGASMNSDESGGPAGVSIGA